MFSYPRVGLNGRQSLKGDVAFLDFLSYVSIKDANTVMRFKGFDII